MSDTLTTLKELAAQVRGATRKGENTAERVGRLFVGILALMEESEISFEPSEGYDTLGTLKELAAQVRSATEDSENTAERVGRGFAGILDLLEQSGIEFDTAEGDDSIEILQSLSDQVRGATRKGENTSERVGRLFAGILNLWAMRAEDWNKVIRTAISRHLQRDQIGHGGLSRRSDAGCDDNMHPDQHRLQGQQIPG